MGYNYSSTPPAPQHNLSPSPFLHIYCNLYIYCRVLPRHGLQLLHDGRLHLPLGRGAARDFGPPGRNARRLGLPRLPGRAVSSCRPCLPACARGSWQRFGDAWQKFPPMRVGYPPTWARGACCAAPLSCGAVHRHAWLHTSGPLLIFLSRNVYSPPLSFMQPGVVLRACRPCVLPGLTRP